MIEQIKIYEAGILAFEIIDHFDQTDRELVHKWFEEKLVRGYDRVNLLIKLDEAKIGKEYIKGFFKDSLYSFHHIDNFGNIAVVAHSRIVEVLTSVDNFFFERATKDFTEKYFDISQTDEAFSFVENN